MEIACHTFAHANLGSLDDNAMCLEVRKGLNSLLELFGDRVAPLLAYPYGIPPRRELLLDEVGISASFLVTGGWIRDTDAGRRFSWPRWNVVAGNTASGFRARLRGWFCE
jgi:peptidoglycan/xylan/chitin deacetylase (PgdA/CDA1 family)